MILTGTNNTYSGGTTISGGTLLVNNTNGSGTGSGAVTVDSGGTLGGAGIISGAVTVNSGGAFAPGNPLGTLTISNNLTLAAGSTTFVQVQHSPLTNDAVKDFRHADRRRHFERDEHRRGGVHRWRQFPIIQRCELYRFFCRLCPAVPDRKAGLEHQHR